MEDTIKNDSELKDNPFAGLGEALISGLLASSEVFLVVTEDSVFQFNPVFGNEDGGPYHGVAYTITDEGIAFTAASGVLLTLKKRDKVFALTGSETDVLYSKVNEQREKELRTKAEQSIANHREYSRKVALLSTVLEVRLLDKGYYEYGYNDYLTFHVSIQNTANRDIQAFNGVFQFFDLLDNELYSVRWMDDDGLGAFQEEEKSLQVDYNQFDDGLSVLKDKEI